MEIKNLEYNAILDICYFGGGFVSLAFRNDGAAKWLEAGIMSGKYTLIFWTNTGDFVLKKGRKDLLSFHKSELPEIAKYLTEEDRKFVNLKNIEM